MKKILQILAIKPKGGVGSFLKNIYQDPNFYPCDIIESATKTEGEFDDFFLEKGCHIFLFPAIKYSNLLRYFYACKKFYKEHHQDYWGIHVHSTAIAPFHLYFAKKYGIKVRIMHCHSNIRLLSIGKKIRNSPFNSIITSLASDYLACSKVAGASLFGSKDFTIIPNSIVIDRFRFSSENRKNIRQYWQLNDKKIVGIVGRIEMVKNPFFVLELAEKMLHQPDICFMWIGEGSLQEKLQQQVIKRRITNLHFIPCTSAIEQYYSAIDLLILPSFREGFSLVALESQCSGAPLFFSDKLDKDMKLLEKSLMLPLQNSNAWCDAIIQFSPCTNRYEAAETIGKNYSIEKCCKKLGNFYNHCLHREDNK